jgi:hypothetical protein
MSHTPSTAAHERIHQLALSAPVTTFALLPVEAQKALAFYMAFDGEAWAPYWDRARELHERGQGIDPARMSIDDALPGLLDMYGAYPITLVDVSMRDLQEVIASPEAPYMQHERLTSWDEYHAHYQRTHQSDKRGRPPGGTEVWPVILTFEHEEIIQDGWHRFHDYAEAGLQSVPALYYPEDETSRAVQRQLGSLV